MFAQGGQSATALFDVGSDLPAQIHEVMLAKPNDMEAIRNDPGIREVALDERPVACAHIDANDLYLMPSVQGFKKGMEVSCALALGHIKDPMSFEITEGGGEAAAFVEGVFVNPKHLRAARREPQIPSW